LEIQSVVPTVLLLVALVLAGVRIIVKQRGAPWLIALGAVGCCALDALLWACHQSRSVELISVATTVGWTLLIGFWEETSSFLQRSGPRVRWVAECCLQALVLCGAALFVADLAEKLSPSTLLGHGWGWLFVLAALASAVALGVDRAVPYLRPTIRRKLSRLSSFCVALLIALLLLEVAWVASGCMGYNGWEVYDNDGYYRGSFGLKREFSVPIVQNSRGYHDVEHKLSRSTETERILLLGDSYIEAIQVGLEQTISRRLEKVINSRLRARQLECIALGSNGTGPVWQEEILEKEGLGYDPSIVVSEFLPANDVRDSDLALSLLTRQELRYRLNQGSVYGQVRRRRLQAAGALLYRIDRLLVDYRTGGFNPYLMVFHDPPLDSVWHQAWSRTEQAIISMSTLASQHGAFFVVAIFSSAVEIEAWHDPEQANSMLAASAARLGFPASGWDYQYPAHRVEQLCRRNDIPVLNLTKIFAELPAHQRARIHLQADGHWSPLGHQLAADALAGFLEEHLQELKDLS
jgi:hypothetical protein